MNFNVTVDDFNKICRICIYYDEKYELISLTAVSKLLRACTSIEISETELDELPQKICEECVKYLESFYAFKEKCENSENYLRQILLNAKKQNFENDSSFVQEPSNATIKSEINSDQEAISTDQFQDNLRSDSEDDYPLTEFNKKEENEENASSETKYRKRSKNNHKCDQCGKSFPYSYRLKQHKIVHSDEKDFFCEYCSKYFKTKKSLNRHYLRLHSKEFGKTREEAISTDQFEDSLHSDSADDYPLTEYIKKEENGESTSSETKYRKRSKNNHKCDQCGKSFPYSYRLKEHKTAHSDEKDFFCEYCSKYFKTEKCLSRHYLRVHSKEFGKTREEAKHRLKRVRIKPRRRSKDNYECDKCGKSFVFPYMLRNHQAAVHSDEKTFSCDKCSKQFRKNLHLRQHIDRCHSESPRDICNMCGKSIKRIYMKRHIAIHQMNSSFACSECGKDFDKRARLEQHMKIAHNQIMTVHKYLCTVCGRNVISPKDLENHMRVHTGERPYQCQMCDKNYKTSSNLSLHIRFTHKNERPFSCDICFKGFISRQKLNRHKQTHSSSRNHVCIVCGKLFGYESVLKSHMKISHKVFTETN